MGIANNKKPEPKRYVDAYICPDLHTTITKVCKDAVGHPPMRIKCTQCDQPAQSQGFNVNQSFSPVFEWYKPTPDQMKVLTLNMKKDEYNRFTELTSKGLLVARPCDERRIDSTLH